MSSYQLSIPKPVGKQIGRLQRRERDRIDAVLLSLEKEPHPLGSRKLSGRDEYRVRVGDYRIVYIVDDEQMQVEVLRGAHHREAYRRK